MMNTSSMVDQRFGRLTVKKQVPKSSGYRGLMWECVCDCGRVVVTRGTSLRSEHAKSCGCLKVEIARDLGRASVTHGAAGKGCQTPEYRVWCGMHGRCCNPGSKYWRLYGERGIHVCSRWANSFEAFLEDMGPRPSGTSIDRIDVNGNYEPGNCRWATRLEQARNKQDTEYVEFAGEKLAMTAWAERVGVTAKTLRYRLRRWPIDKALTHPPQ